MENMRYAKKILSDELRILKNSIGGSGWSRYKEALKIREQKCKDLEQAIKLIDETNIDAI